MSASYARSFAGSPLMMPIKHACVGDEAIVAAHLPALRCLAHGLKLCLCQEVSNAIADGVQARRLDGIAEGNLIPSAAILPFEKGI